MSFLSRVFKKENTDDEPQLKQANVGQKLEAYYDDKLKRWVFPGEVCVHL
jgi:hypothetical protein